MVDLNVLAGAAGHGVYMLEIPELYVNPQKVPDAGSMVGSVSLLILAALLVGQICRSNSTRGT